MAKLKMKEGWGEIEKCPGNEVTHSRAKKDDSVAASSSIQTLLSALESHQILPFLRLAGFTAGRETHPALKIGSLGNL